MHGRAPWASRCSSERLESRLSSAVAARKAATASQGSPVTAPSAAKTATLAKVELRVEVAAEEGHAPRSPREQAVGVVECLHLEQHGRAGAPQVAAGQPRARPLHARSTTAGGGARAAGGAPGRGGARADRIPGDGGLAQGGPSRPRRGVVRTSLSWIPPSPALDRRYWSSAIRMAGTRSTTRSSARSRFDDFVGALAFVNRVGELAERRTTTPTSRSTTTA